ncbi:MAG TPA: ribonuclease P protein component [Acidimicrobiia bacterium]|nr:ribonuclease P protein component [Acidimicrobiia bacterium]
MAGSPPPVRLIWRVRDRATFAALRHARPWRQGLVTVRAVCVSRHGDPPRVAYAVGRAAGTAVHRNRLRRRLRAAVHEERAALRAGAAYLVGAAPGAHGLDAATLRRDVAGALRRASGALR